MPLPTFRLLALLVLFALPAALRAQCDEATVDCEDLLGRYQSSGQYYRAQLFPGEDARLKLTFYRDTRYRIVPCGAGENGARLIITLFDKTGKQLYSNEGRPGDPHVDVSFGATSDYTLVARFAGDGAGCAAILVGYRPPDDDSDDDI